MTNKILACGALAAALMAGTAFAAKTPVITTINGGGSSLALPTYDAEFSLYSSSKSKVVFTYAGAGSGAGQNAFLNNNIGYFEPNSTSNSIGYAAGTQTNGNAIVGTSVAFGASDAFLSSTQVNGYTRSTTDGPLIQLPTIGVPVTMAYNSVSGGSVSVPAANYANAPSATNGITLTDAQVCGVLSGKITDWNTLDSSIPAGTTITVVYRTDGSGTTFLTTQHLDAVCNSTNSNFTTTALAAPTKAFASLFASVPANFVGASGSGGVQTTLLNTPGSIGYLSPDFTDIAPLSANSPKNTSFVLPTTAAAGTTLPVAAVVNPNAAAGGTAYFPTVTNTEVGLNHPATGSTNPTPPNTASAAANPLLWVPAIPQTSLGYSIVGYTTIDLSSCYVGGSASLVGKALIAILKDTYQKTGTYNTIITNNGFSPLVKTGAVNYVKSITNVFLTNNSGYNLNIDNATVCASHTGR